MGILDKLLKGNQVKEQEFAKADIFLYGEVMDEPTSKDDDNYVIVGCFNGDKTKFKNLLTGEVFDCELDYKFSGADETGLCFNRMKIGDKVYGQINKYRRENIQYSGNKYYIEMLYCGKFDWMGRIYYGETSWKDTIIPIEYPLNKMKPVYKFVEKASFDGVKLSEMKALVEIINAHALRVISKELDNKKKLEDLRIAGYNKF